MAGKAGMHAGAAREEQKCEVLAGHAHDRTVLLWVARTLEQSARAIRWVVGRQDGRCELIRDYWPAA